MRRGFVSLLMLAVVLAPVLSLWAQSPAEAQSRSNPLPQFDWNANQAAKQADANARAWEGVKQAKSMYDKAKLAKDIYTKGAEEVARDLAKKEASKRNALPEYIEIVKETQKTKKEVELNYFERLKGHFSCFAQQLAGAENCDRDRDGGSDNKGNNNGNNFHWECPPGYTVVSDPNYPSGGFCCPPSSGTSPCVAPKKVHD